MRREGSKYLYVRYVVSMVLYLCSKQESKQGSAFVGVLVGNVSK